MSIPYNPTNVVQYKEPNLPYLPACIMSGLVVYPLAVVLFIPPVLIACAIYNIAYPTGQFIQDLSVAKALRAFVVASVFACSGFTIGLFQKHLIMRYFNLNLSKWRLVSIMGACLAGCLILYASDSKDYLLAAMAGPLGDRFDNYYSLMRSFIYTPMIQFTLILSAIQTAYLYQYLRSAWLWLAVNVVAGALFFWLFVYALGEASVLSWLVAAITQPALVGCAMEYLMTRRRRGGKAKRKDA